MAEPLLELEDVRVLYGRLVAVDGVSFALRGGELLGMIGPNGAGKTTTLRAAAGLQPISTGRVRVMGRDVFSSPVEAGHHLGFTPDTPALYDTLTVEDFLEFVARCYGLPRSLAAERRDHWLSELWLADKRKAKIATLSRGMKQRLAVARTLLPDPHVVLLDEPAAGLDPAGRAQFRRLLAGLRDQGKALIVSSHILADLAEYCTHIAIIGHGRLLSWGTVAEVAGAAAAERCRYQVVLAQRVGDAATRLAGIEGVVAVEVDGDVLKLECGADRVSAARLLERLIRVGLPVAEFRPLRPDLEEAYLRSGIGQVD
jgi:ABC-2 type transport system ATP-binding protein